MQKLSCLEYGETRLAEIVESASFFWVNKPPSEYLHPQKCKNENEENEEDQQCIDGGDGIDQTLYQVTHTGPVSEGEHRF